MRLILTEKNRPRQTILNKLLEAPWKNNSFKAGNNKKENEIQKRVPINWKTNSGFFSLTNCVNRRDIKNKGTQNSNYKIKS